MKCRKILFAGAGMACGPSVNGEWVMCSEMGYCGMGGVCIPHAADGATCDQQAGPLCSVLSGCTGGVCRAEDPSGC
jgi:hypothetical protein